MKNERLNYWKCPKCHGTGRRIILNKADPCFACDGTGNALVDGEAEAHKRRLRKIDNLKSEASALLD